MYRSPSSPLLLPLSMRAFHVALLHVDSKTHANKVKRKNPCNPAAKMLVIPKDNK